MSTLVSIFGANASGKSSLARAVMTAAGTPRPFSFDLKEAGYEFILPNKSRLYVVGRYKTACGGLDTFSYKGAAEDITIIVNDLLKRGNVFCEGILHMSSWGHQRLVNLSEDQAKLGNHVIYGMLNPPWEVVLERIAQRQAASTRKRTTPFDPEKTVRGKHSGVPRSIAKLAASGCDTREIDWKNPLPQVAEWLGL